MPTYEYRCQDCGYEFEEFQPISDPPILVCPSCNGRTKRLISGGAGLLFKGSGFYITDHRTSSYKADAAKDNGGISSPSSGSKTDKSNSGTGKTAASKPGKS